MCYKLNPKILPDIKKKYKKLLHKILVNRLQRSEWLFLLSSVDFRQAFSQYLKQYQKHRLEQVRFIRSTITSLENKIKNLSVEKTEFALHKEEMQQQQQILNSELEKREALIKSLSQSEKTLFVPAWKSKKEHEGTQYSYRKCHTKWNIAQAKKSYYHLYHT